MLMILHFHLQALVGNVAFQISAFHMNAFHTDALHMNAFNMNAYD